MSEPTTLDLLWGTQQRPKRGPKPSLSRERIVAEAVALADAEGLANLSMARLAERLGCAKMALYQYVPGKAELVALMVDTGIGAPPRPAAPKSDTTEEPWRVTLRTWATTIHDRYRTHPWSIEATMGARLYGPNEMNWLEVALTALTDTGLTGAERLDTVVLLNGHVRSLVQVTAGGTDNPEQELASQVGTVLAAHAERYPAVIAAFTDSAPQRSDANNALYFGIDRILDGIGALIATRARP